MIIELTNPPGGGTTGPTLRRVTDWDCSFRPWKQIQLSAEIHAPTLDSIMTDRSDNPSERPHPRDPLHGITLENILNQLVARHGWAAMADRIPVRCFQYNPSVKSSLTFLRKTPWARKKVEAWFIDEQPLD